MARKNIVAGNWKMNKTFDQGVALAKEVIAQLPAEGETIVIMATPYIHLSAVGELVKGQPNVFLAAQNCHQEESGAYTGEISMDMLNSVGVDYVILGHSERREYFGESDELLAQKVNTVLGKGKRPIFCCGEGLVIREANTHESYVAAQLEKGLFHLDATQIQEVVIAYEPIWAIGTGVTASPAQAQDMHRAIRALLANKYGEEVANNISILYGGSCKPTNAKELFGQSDVDGGLIGGASLKANDFVAIVDAF